jgi:hypothetical protein
MNGQEQPTVGIAVGQKSSDSISGRDLLTRGLNGNKSYAVGAELRGPTKDLGLSSNRIAEQIQARLRQANINVDQESGSVPGTLIFPKLFFNLDVVPLPDGEYYIAIRAVVQDFLVKLNPCSTTVPCKFFIGESYSQSRTRFASSENVGQEIRLGIDELLDSFINDHLRMNPQGQSRPATK